MARVRSGGGGTGAVWALVLLGAGFLISLMLAIVFFVQLGKARTEKTDALAELNRYANNSDRQSPVVRGLIDSAGNRSVVGMLQQESETMRNIIGVSNDAAIDVVRQQVATVIEKEVGGNATSLLNEVRALKSELAAEGVRLEQETAALEQAREALAAAEEEKTQLSNLYDESVMQMGMGYAQFVETSETNAENLRSGLGQLEDQLAAVRASMQTEIDDLQSGNDALAQENASLKSTIEELRRKQGDIGTEPVIQPDAMVASVLDQSNMVYLDIGSQDNLLLGMTFEIVEKGKPITLDQFDEFRGKATVQIVEINEVSSLARIVRLDEQAILREGDQAINLVFNPGQQFSYFIYGKFNMDGIGEASFADSERIRDVVERWGGNLAKELTYEVDFLVLGVNPEPPTPLAPGELDVERIREFQQQKEIYETYQTLLEEAEDLRIPVLNQNRFLSLIGYYQR